MSVKSAIEKVCGAIETQVGKLDDETSDSKRILDILSVLNDTMVSLSAVNQSTPEATDS